MGLSLSSTLGLALGMFGREEKKKSETFAETDTLLTRRCFA